MAVVFLAGGVLLIVGPLLGGPGLLGLIGFVAIGVGYGIVNNAHVVTESRLQDAIAVPARATVTSVAGLAAEVVALAIFGIAALASMWWSTPVTVAVLGTPPAVTTAQTRPPPAERARRRCGIRSRRPAVTSKRSSPRFPTAFRRR